MNIDKTLDSLRSIKLKGGIFGKTTLLLIVLCICVSTVCVASRVWWLALVLMVPLMAMVFYMLKKCLDFAEKNPQAAIMEGSELLVHEKLMFAQKYQTEDPSLQATVFDHVPPELPSDEVTSPDPTPTQALPQETDIHREED